MRAAVFAAPLVLAACQQAAPPPPPPPEVTVAQPLRRDVQTYSDFTGTTRATEFAEIRARVSGRLEKIRFTPGDLVEAGDVLFEIEREPYEALRDAAAANLMAAERSLTQAQSDLLRVEQAGRTRAVSERDIERARAGRDTARAAVLEARAHLEQAKINLGYATVTTPISGRVGRNLVDAGNLVGSGEATLLTTVNRVQPIHVYFDAPEGDALQYLNARRGERRGMAEENRTKVLVATASDEGFPHEGEIDFIDNAVKEATGTIEVRAVLPNEELVLLPGLFVRLRAVGKVVANGVLVRERAIGTDLGGKYVLVVGDDNVVELRYVTLGPVQEDGTVLVLGGLDGSETYIVEGLLRARPGFPVRPERAEAKTGESGTRQAEAS